MTKPLRLLQVEDSASDADLIVRQLEKAGYDVHTEVVQDETAMAGALARTAFDIVIADYRLPEFNAGAALSVLKRHGADIPFIVVSGTIGEEAAVALMRSGAHDYLLKDKMARLAPVVARELAEAETRKRRREAEQSLAQNRARFDMAIEAAQLGMLDGDLRTGVFSASSLSKEHFGLGPDAEFSRETLIQTVHPDDRERVLRLTEESLRPGSTGQYSMEYRTVGAHDGKERWISVWGRVLFDDRHEPTRLVGATRDITAGKEAEQRLQLQLQLTQAIAHQSTDSIFVIDFAGNATFANAEAERAFGYSLEELLSRPLNNLLKAPESVEEAARLEFSRQATRAGQSVRDHEAIFLRKDGSSVYVSCSASPLNLNGQQVGMVLSVRDITGRKQSEVALRESEERLRRLVEADVVGIMIGSADCVLEANDHYLRMIGYTREELLAGKIVFAAITAEEHRVACDRSLAQLAETGKCSAFEKEYVRKNGTRVPVLLGGVALERSPLRFLGFVVDLTERKSLEEQFRQAQRMESIGQLAAGVAHDFNNLLTIISGYAEMALGSVGKGHQLHDQMEEICNAATRAAGLTRQLLTFSRQQPTAPKNIELNTLVKDLDRMLRRLIGEHIEFSLSLGEEAGTLHADPGQIEQVIMNLVINAQDAMPDGGKLIVETSAVTVDEQASADRIDPAPGRYVALRVTDTGIGMSAEVKARIFEPFFTTKEYGKGTGLGLSTVYGIVRQNRASILVESEPGRGSCFTVLFPHVESERPPGPDVIAIESDIGMSGSGRILLVEDEAGVRRFIKHVLEEYGYTVTEASNGQLALHILGREEEIFDLLITDMIMPELGGAVLIAGLRALRPEVPVLRISGYTERFEETENSGEAWLQKPFTPGALLESVRALIGAGPLGASTLGESELEQKAGSSH